MKEMLKYLAFVFVLCLVLVGVPTFVDYCAKMAGGWLKGKCIVEDRCIFVIDRYNNGELTCADVNA